MAESEQEIGAGVLVVTHGAFGEELIKAAETVLGPQERAESVGVDVDRGVDKTVEAIREAIQRTSDKRGTIILTDLFGGSPTTLSLSLLKSEKVEVVTGVNLPMLVKALQSRQKPLAEIASDAAEAGRQGIKVAGALLNAKPGSKKGKH